MDKLLLHVCCGPCAPYVFKVLSQRYEVTGFFYNPNIYPREEYDFRRRELEQAAHKMGWSMVFAEYDPLEWREAVRGLESEPERGKRCPVCFHFRLRRSFLFAKSMKFDCLATTLSISPYKSAEQINAQGERLAAEYSIGFLPANFKKQSGFQIGRKMAADLEIRHQRYCGCEFSAADMVRHDALKPQGKLK